MAPLAPRERQILARQTTYRFITTTVVLGAAAAHVAVAPADDAPPDPRDRREQPLRRGLFHAVSARPGDQRAQRAGPLAVSECGALCGAVCRQPADRRPAH